MLNVYKFFVFVFSFFIPLYMKKRCKLGKEDKLRVGERYGLASIQRPYGRLMWIHAASVGEANSILYLVKSILKKYPDLSVLVTTTTASSGKLMKNKLPVRAFHQYIAFDVNCWVKRFLDYWKPDFSLWVESEIWPNFICEVSKRNIPLVLLNGSMSDKSFKKWKILKFFIRNLLSRYSLCIAKSIDDAKKLTELGANNVKSYGNLKFSSDVLLYDKDNYNSLKKIIGKRSIWLASSTHEGEENLISYAHLEIKKQIPDVLTILAPRHPERCRSINNNIVNKYQLKVAQRSLKEKIENDTDIYIVDTLGELGLFYKLVEIVFIGGSLVPVGGHNIIEPAQLGCAIVYGPHMFNSPEIIDVFAKESASIGVDGIDDLISHVLKFFNSDELRLLFAKNALRVVDYRKKRAHKMFTEIFKIIDN